MEGTLLPFGIALTTGLWSFLIAVLAGFSVRYILRWLKASYEINWTELGIGVAVIALVTTPGVSFAGTKIAHDAAVGGFIEYWGGSIKAISPLKEVACHRDGSCANTYDCDPYIETYYSNKKLKTRTKYHRCPYATKEYSFMAETTLGKPYELRGVEENPQRFRSGKEIPSNIQRGVPNSWAKADSLLKQGILPPAVKENVYVNYYLVSRGSIQKEYGGDVPEYRKRELLGPHTVNYQNAIYDGINAKKVVYAGRGFKLNNEEAWQETAMYLNAKVGYVVRGDVHMFVVPASQVGEGEALKFTNALLAHMQSDEFGKHGFAKNGILLVVAVDDAQQKVVWSRAKTGLPGGNNASMIGELSRRLAKTDFTPDSLLGKPIGRLEAGNPVYSKTDGLVDKIVNHEAPYQRECMDCTDADDKGTGFTYLDSETLISGWARFWIVFFGVLVAGIVWAVFAYMPWFEGIHPGRRRARSMHNTFSE